MEEETKHVEENTTKRTSRLKKRALAAGFLTAAFFVLTTFLAWKTVEHHRRVILQSSGHITATAIAEQVKGIVDNNLAVLESFADNWQSGPPEDEREYLSVATPLQSRFPALQAINWITPNYIILYVAPIKGNVPAMGADLKRHPVAGPVLDIALDQRRTQITPTIELIQGGRGFAAYSPVLDRDGEIIGVVNAAFRIRSMLASVINTEQADGYTVRVSEGDSVLFEIRGEGDDESLQQSVTFDVVGRQWQIDVIADPEVAARIIDPDLILIFGAFTTVLFTIVVFLLSNQQKAALRRAVHHINAGDDINDLLLTITKLDGSPEINVPGNCGIL